jgi:small subunit ribosomal protein S21
MIDSDACFRPVIEALKRTHWTSGHMEIKVFNNNVEKALKVAKKKLAGEGLFRELKRRRFYEKPSVRKKAKQREAQRRRQKWLAKRRMD